MNLNVTYSFFAYLIYLGKYESFNSFDKLILSFFYFYTALKKFSTHVIYSEMLTEMVQFSRSPVRIILRCSPVTTNRSLYYL